MIEQTVLDGVVVLRLAHGRVNALDVELCDALGDALHEAAGGSATAVVLTGGDRLFSAGVDLHRLLAGGKDYVHRFVPAMDRLFVAALGFPKPLVAALSGHAIAGACILAAAADVVVAAEGPGMIGVPELAVGVPFPAGALAVLRQRLGQVGARRVILDAKNYTVNEALARGLVDEVVAGERVLDRAVSVASNLAAVAPADAFALTKRQLRGEDVDADAVLDVWDRRLDDGWTSAYLTRVTGR